MNYSNTLYYFLLLVMVSVNSRSAKESPRSSAPKGVGFLQAETNSARMARENPARTVNRLVINVAELYVLIHNGIRTDFVGPLFGLTLYLGLSQVPEEFKIGWQRILDRGEWKHRFWA